MNRSLCSRLHRRQELLSIPLLVQTYYLIKQLPYNPFTDLSPVVDIVRNPLWIPVSTQRTAATNMAELVAEAKANIRTGRGPVPQGMAGVFVARDVIERLGPRIQRPKD